MKQVAKTQQVMDRLRAAFGPDVDVSRLAVYETAALNTQPLRKSGGIFKGARITPATLTQIANSINSESAPMRLEHGDEGAPYGRVFYGEVVGDEARALFTVDDAEMVRKIDSGTLDQVSVGFMPAAINCSACGFNFIGSDATFENLYTLTCNDGHTMNENGAHAWVDGMASFQELSLVGKGAAQGARIVGPSESRLAAGNDNYRALAAKAGFSGLALTCEPIETPTPKDTLNVDITMQLTAAVEAKTKAEMTVISLTEKNTALTDQLAAVKAQLDAVDTTTAEKLVASEAEVATAVVALTEEAKMILTALQKPVDNLPTTVAELTALIAEHRAEFAAAIPVGGRAKPSAETGETTTAPARSAAFSTRR
jgi:hypothetical protein